MVSNAGGANSLLLAHICDCLFQKVKVLHAGNVLKLIDNYHQVKSLVTRFTS